MKKSKYIMFQDTFKGLGGFPIVKWREGNIINGKLKKGKWLE